jgi:hypothetical protein
MFPNFDAIFAAAAATARLLIVMPAARLPGADQKALNLIGDIVDIKAPLLFDNLTSIAFAEKRTPRF